MVSEKIQKALNDQIMREEQSSRIYLAMASWCETNGFQGAADFLYGHSDEERMHQLKLVHYLNDRGGYATLQKLDETKSEFKSLQDIFEAILEHEKYITGCINDIYELCLKEKDYTTGNFIQWYINEQIEEESLVNTVLDKMKLAGNDKAGLFHIDKELAAMNGEAK